MADREFANLELAPSVDLNPEKQVQEKRVLKRVATELNNRLLPSLRHLKKEFEARRVPADSRHRCGPNLLAKVLGYLELPFQLKPNSLMIDKKSLLKLPYNAKVSKARMKRPEYFRAALLRELEEELIDIEVDKCVDRFEPALERAIAAEQSNCSLTFTFSDLTSRLHQHYALWKKELEDFVDLKTSYSHNPKTNSFDIPYESYYRKKYETGETVVVVRAGGFETGVVHSSDNDSARQCRVMFGDRDNSGGFVFDQQHVYRLPRVTMSKHNGRPGLWERFETALSDEYKERGFVVHVTHNNVDPTKCGNGKNYPNGKVDFREYAFAHRYTVQLDWSE